MELSTSPPNDPLVKLTPKQVAAIHGLLSYPHIEDAAEAAGVSRSGLYKMMVLPHFREALALLQRERFAALNQQLTMASLEAVTMLRTMLADTAIVPSSRIRAAEILLAHALKGYELVTLETRIAALESTMGESNDPYSRPPYHTT